MPPNDIQYEILDDDAKWADPNDCVDLWFAGIWFLYESLLARYPGCPLLSRIAELGNRLDRLRDDTRGDPAQIPGSIGTWFTEETHILGTLGYSLWHLRAHLTAAPLDYEIGQLSKVTCDGSEVDSLRLRSHGFLLLAAAIVAKQGFTLEFIARRKGVATPDFYATRGGNRFTCEVTTLDPRQGNFESVDFFWTKIIEAIEEKARQLKSPEFHDGVLIIDCTRIWSAFGHCQFAIGGQLVYFVPLEQGGPRNGSVPLVRYDKCEVGDKLKNLEFALTDRSIHTLVLFYGKFETTKTEYRRPSGYAVVGTIVGAKFWSYFPQTLVIPGPNVTVRWE
jgi:hypothetical protein